MEGKEIDSKLWLLTSVLVLIVLLLFNYLFKGNSTDPIWNYKEITSAINLTYLGEKIDDRKIYYTLENIVDDYVNSYIVNEDKSSYKYYYQYLREDYKKYLGKKKYYEVSESFLKKFYININSDYEKMDTSQLIKQVYLFDNNVYLCILEGRYKKETGYFAVMLNESSNTYNIVYIE